MRAMGIYNPFARHITTASAAPRTEADVLPLIKGQKDRVAVLGYIDTHLGQMSFLLDGVKGDTGKGRDDRMRLKAEIDRLLQCRRDLCTGDAATATR
jgi:hypothetical protein